MSRRSVFRTMIFTMIFTSIEVLRPPLNGTDDHKPVQLVKESVVRTLEEAKFKIPHLEVTV